MTEIDKKGNVKKCCVQLEWRNSIEVRKMFSLWNRLNIEIKKLSFEEARNWNLEVIEKSPGEMSCGICREWVKTLQREVIASFLHFKEELPMGWAFRRELERLAAPASLFAVCKLKLMNFLFYSDELCFPDWIFAKR